MKKDISLGLCHCGCGNPAPIATCNRAGQVKGAPVRFIRGHGRWAGHIVNLPYHEQDRGYTTPCWIFDGYVNPKTGYGYAGRSTAHRLMFERVNGPLPRGIEPDHLCRVRQCINPDHLDPVTRSENMRRSPIAGRPRKDGSRKRERV